jgi:hypothetical protein
LVLPWLESLVLPWLERRVLPWLERRVLRRPIQRCRQLEVPRG